jgi:predicted transposase YdaD
MPLPFDATLKDLVRHFLRDYEIQMGLSDLGPLTPLNVDLSTVTAATDIALGHGYPPDHVVDINFQSGPDVDLPARVLLYHALLHFRFGVPMHSVVVLLRPVADQRQLTGKVDYVGRRRKGKIQFRYEVIRLWQQPVRRFLDGGLGTLPLAPLCRLPAGSSLEAALVPVIRRVVERLEREAVPDDRAKLLTATYVLAGLRVTPDVAARLFQGVRAMKESSTYQAILAEGRTEGRTEGRIEALQRTLLRQGRQQFHSQPSEAVQATIQAIRDEGRLERMTERLLVASSWNELLETP